MGYRSDVVQAIAFPSKDKLLSFLTECRLDGVIDKDELNEYVVKVWSYNFGGTENIIEFVYVLEAKFNDVKWYDYFEDVKQHEAMLELANEKGFPTCFIRIGEDTGDTVQEVCSGPVDDFEFLWWEYGYEVIRSYDIAEGDATLTMQDFLKTNRSSDDGQQPETSESQDAVSA